MTNRCLFVSLGLLGLAIPLRAANLPHAGTDRQSTVVWRNKNVERLHDVGLTSIVDPIEEGRLTSAHAPRAYVRSKDAEWYAAQAAKLRYELERRSVELDQYRHTLADVRDLRKTTGGINLDEGDAGVTPQAAIEILERNVDEARAELDALEDLARHNGIPPGKLRGE